jgi:dTDP-4-amino-4,6-dideoxygalactose transaminase
MPGPGHEWIGAEERDGVLEVVESGHLFRYGKEDDPSFRKKVHTFERELEAACGVRHAVATTSGSASLIAALLAVGLGPGDEVIVPAYTFVATYSSIIFCGAVPVLAEIDESLNLDPRDVEGRISAKTRAVMPVHMLGNPCHMDAIQAVAEKHGLTVIEDACQAVGGSYRGRRLGTIGRIGAYSLNVFKTITAGDGGAVVTDDTDLYHRAFAIHDQGHLPQRTGVEVGARSILGLNFRMNELTGAVALAQLRKLDAILATLREKKTRLKREIGSIAGMRFRTLPDPDGECATLCTVIFDDAGRAARVADRLGTTTVDRSGWHVYANMEHVMRWLSEHGRPSGKGAYPRTDDILSRSINLSVGVVDAGLGAAFGIHIGSSDEDIERTARTFRAACAG